MILRLAWRGSPPASARIEACMSGNRRRRWPARQSWLRARNESLPRVNAYDVRSWTKRAQLRLIWGLVCAVAIVQAATWMIAGTDWWRPALVVSIVAAWIVTLALAVLASRRIGALSTRLTAREHAHRATLDEIEQLQTQNAMLQIVARSIDVPLAFQELAVRVARLVPCDRVGLALLSDSGEEFETFTARVNDEERYARARADVVFKIEGTAIGAVTRSAQPLLFKDVRKVAAQYLDANVVLTAGFRSALLMPLVSSGRGVGTLNLVARAENAFNAAHVDVLRPIAEILAVAHVAQRQHSMLAKYRTIETMADTTLSIASEINGSLQTIAGQCGLLERSYPDVGLQRDLATITIQARRIAELLDRMRVTTQDRLQEVAHTIDEEQFQAVEVREVDRRR